MAIKSEKDIYNVLEKHLRAAAYPRTVTMLMDIAEVHDTAIAELSSDGDLREGHEQTLRHARIYVAPRTAHPVPRAERVQLFCPFLLHLGPARELSPSAGHPIARAAVGNIGFTITEIDDGVLLEFQKFSVMIKSKT